jgi:hypothetical protein
VIADEDDAAPPSVFVGVADRLDLVAGAVRDYITTDVAPWPHSISSRESAEERDYLALPRQHPMIDTQLAPRHYLGSSADHLTAFAATIRAPQSVMALPTLLRTQVVGAAYAAYLAVPEIGTRERVRRWVNTHLDSLTEQMRLIGRADAESAAQYDELEERRRKMKAGARELGWTVVGNDTPKQKAWPTAWYINPRPTEMDLVDQLLSGVDAPKSVGKTLYRFLSASSHVQPHALLALISRENTVSHGDGSATASLALSGSLLLTYTMVATAGLTIAMDRCLSLYGWPLERWQREVVPFANEIRSQLGVQPTPRGVQLLG